MELEIILIPIIFGLIAAVILAVCIVQRYKHGCASSMYPLEHYTRLNLTERDDVFLTRHVSRVKVASNKKR